MCPPVCVCVLAPRKIQGIKEGRRKLKAFVTPHPESPNRATKLLVHTLYWPTSCTPADPAFLAGKTAFAYLRGGGCNGGALTREGERRFLAKFILLACSWLRYSTSLFVQDFSPLFNPLCLDNLWVSRSSSFYLFVVFNSYSYSFVEKLVER